MKQRYGILMFAVLASAASVAKADKVVLKSGSELSGTIDAISATKVTLDRGGTKQDIEANTIKYLEFDGDNPRMRLVRRDATDGRYENALQNLEQIASDEKSPDRNVNADVEYFRVYSQARLALQGNGDVAEAGRALRDFVTANSNSYHFYEATEALGDLMMAAGDKGIDAAIVEYNKLVGAPWDDYQIRGGVAKGRALLTKGEHAEASRELDKAIQLAAGKAEYADLTLAATLGKAECLSATEQYEQAITDVTGVIESADPENVSLHANAYNTLGKCYQAQGKLKDSMLAFLHVDLLYLVDAQAHAEALYHLVDVYTKLERSNRAAEAMATLKTRYPNSPWANK